MKKPLAAAALAAASSVAPLEMAASQIQTHDLERKISHLLDDAKAPFVELSEDDFRALGADLTLPDAGQAVTALAQKAPEDAFDPPTTHYGHLELPRQLAAAHSSVVRWLVRPE